MNPTFRTLLLSLLVAVAVASAALAAAGDEHWSRQFPKPAKVTEMSATTGMSSGGGKPTVARAKWHRGKLYMAGSWEPGVSGEDPSVRLSNDYWHLWSWSPVKGYEVVSHYHTAQGGRGPDGVINDFEVLPDGRLVVVGEFTRLDNPGGTRYRGVNALAVYDPAEPTANKWKPLGSVQYNGTVSGGGSIYTCAYDPQGNALYLGGTFAGVRATEGMWSPKVHRYDFATGDWTMLYPGVWGEKACVHRIVVDTSTTPSTVYVGGKFKHTAGNGLDIRAGGGTGRYSTGLAAWQDGAGWTTFPTAGAPKNVADEGPLQRAGDYAFFDAVHVHDLLVDGGDIWIVGSFSQGLTNAGPLRGIARWDRERQLWVDPTGKGGFGREAYSIAKAADGCIYVAGAFGGRKGVSEFYEGFKNGEPAAMAVRYDPSTSTWSQLGSGLSGNVMPVCILAPAGNDVFFVGDFGHIDPACFESTKTGKKENESAYIARWNASQDFTKPGWSQPEGADAPWNLDDAAVPEVPQVKGNEHWSRGFPKPPRMVSGKTQQSGATGMDDGVGAPTILAGMAWHGDTLYIGGNWEVQKNERWFVWTYNKTRGWERLAFDTPSKKDGPQSPPEGLKFHEGKLYVYGAISSHSGLAVFDPATSTWSEFRGTYRGNPVVGNGVSTRGGAINDVAWDPKTGDMYLVGSCGLDNPDYEHPKDVGQILRVDRGGEYHTMGHMLYAEDPNKPVLGLYSIAIDPRTEPSTIYVGGTFNYWGGVPTTHKRMAYNVVRWNHEAKDWYPVGKGDFRRLSTLDKDYYPEGLPGLPARADDFPGFIAASFPRVRCMAVDGEGNLYCGGTLAVLDDRLPVKDRKESFGIAKYDLAQDRWVPFTTTGGVSRDIDRMTWLDDETLLLSGSFVYDEKWNLLNNVARLNVKTGVLSPLGGGLLRKGKDQTIGSCVVHTVNDEGLWFAGLFDHAGVNADSTVEGPVESAYIAHWSDAKSFDPNAGLTISPVAPVEGVAGFSSVSRTAALAVENVPAGGTVTWYEKTGTGFKKVGTGPSASLSFRVKAGLTEQTFYVAVTGADGVEGAKLPVRVAVTTPSK